MNPICHFLVQQTLPWKLFARLAVQSRNEPELGEIEVISQPSPGHFNSAKVLGNAAENDIRCKFDPSNEASRICVLGIRHCI